MSNTTVTETAPGTLLSDGRRAAMVPALGKHVRMARRMQQEAGHDFYFALIAQVTTIDGQRIVPEDLDNMPMRDVAVLQAIVEGN